MEPFTPGMSVIKDQRLIYNGIVYEARQDIKRSMVISDQYYRRLPPTLLDLIGIDVSDMDPKPNIK